MRFKHAESIKPGTERIVTEFLWTPRSINGETRWLETAKIEQVFGCHFKFKPSTNPIVQPFGGSRWFDVNWIDT